MVIIAEPVFAEAEAELRRVDALKAFHIAFFCFEEAREPVQKIDGSSTGGNSYGTTKLLTGVSRTDGGMHQFYYDYPEAGGTSAEMATIVLMARN